MPRKKTGPDETSVKKANLISFVEASQQVFGKFFPLYYARTVMAVIDIIQDKSSRLFPFSCQIEGIYRENALAYGEQGQDVGVLVECVGNNPIAQETLLFFAKDLTFNGEKRAVKQHRLSNEMGLDLAVEVIVNPGFSLTPFFRAAMPDYLRLCMWNGFPVPDTFREELGKDVPSIIRLSPQPVGRMWNLAEAIQSVFGAIGKYPDVETEVLQRCPTLLPFPYHPSCETNPDYARHTDLDVCNHEGECDDCDFSDVCPDVDRYVFYVNNMRAAGKKPLSKEFFQVTQTLEYEMALDGIRRGVITGEPHEDTDVFYVVPGSFLRWARDLDVTIPEHLRPLLENDKLHNIEYLRTFYINTTAGLKEGPKARTLGKKTKMMYVKAYLEVAREDEYRDVSNIQKNTEAGRRVGVGYKMIERAVKEWEERRRKKAEKEKKDLDTES
jgi:hypothetical protein